ncbi:MAG TPA: hypothetical protein VLA34_03675 [Candidatus Krumholzibacterium sp.]|nr:hypothetical protein [Candidatus Krumholzibacterium sp.]
MPLVISAGSHSLTLPWYPGPVGERFDPAVTIGTERVLKDRDRWRLYHTGNAGYFQDKWWMTGIYLDTELGAGLYLPLGLHADLRLGIGYLHYFSRRKTLELEGGRYVPSTDYGKPAAVFPMSLLIGYGGSRGRLTSISPFICAKWIIQTPFSEETPAMTHLLVLGGVRIFWGDGGNGRRR